MDTYDIYNQQLLEDSSFVTSLIEDIELLISSSLQQNELPAFIIYDIQEKLSNYNLPLAKIDRIRNKVSEKLRLNGISNTVDSYTLTIRLYHNIRDAYGKLTY